MRTINLRTLRKKTRYKQYDVAKVLNVTQGAVSQWELGVCKPDYKLIKPLSELYNCTIEDLINAINETNLPGVEPLSDSPGKEPA